MGQVPINDLPRDLSSQDAVEATYREDLDWIESKLRQRLSVLVECDKQLTYHLYRALRKRLRRSNTKLRLISGHRAAPTEEEGAFGGMQTVLQRILQELQEAVLAAESEAIIVLPHLDILTTTTRSGLTADTREAAVSMYENPEAVFLGFKDPSFDLPKVIQNAFTVRHSMIGIPRDRLGHIIVQREARKLGVESFNPYSLYKYVSGLNAVRFRQIMGHFSDRVDFDEANPGSAAQIYRELRQMTLVGELELPQVDLDTDIGGYESVKTQLRQEILNLLVSKEKSEDSDRIREIEEIVPKGIILYGPPGTGKTFFAKAIATALDATISIVSGPELKSRWVGESEENLRRVFSQARRSAPSIIVFDELDSFASARGTYTGSGVEHSMVNQLLTEMDGFRKEELVFVVGTTNLVEAIDPALLRPGRFELKIEIPYPNGSDRRRILEIYRDKFALEMSDEIIDFTVQKTGGFVDADRTVRFSGDHLYAVARALKRENLRRGGGKMSVAREDVEHAIRRRKSTRVKLEEQEERTIAIHEAGHAICAYVLPNCPTIDSISIATGEEDALGFVVQAVRENKYVTTRSELLDDICVFLGGRAAESLILDEVSVGAFDDLQRASEIARLMVEELGMSEGIRTFSSPDRPRHVAESTAARIDKEIDQILQEQATHADRTLREHKGELSKLVDLLLEKKEVGLPDLEALFEKES